MDLLSTIKRPLEQEINDFNDYFRSLLKSDVVLMNDALSFLSDSIGKMMRPMLVMLVAKSTGNVNEKTFAAAAAVEMLHTASLLHDDVIDESDKRRGRPSLNVRFNNNVAVLSGDYLFSMALNCTANTGDLRVIDAISVMGRDLPNGEVMQVELQQKGSYSEENYLKVIYYKTASLFVCCSACAVYTAGGSDEYIGKFSNYGKYAGLCFQMKDDIFDYYSNDIGKPTGSDMREGKITLPALYVLRTSQNPLLEPIREKLSKGIYLDEKEIETLIEISKTEGGVEYTNSRINHYRNLAIESIPQEISSEYRNALIAYIDYVITREK
ncbi:MAG: polyprenyl synthetase family protein [Bacteroidaceae bacterium]|nr:polyprenyl synthetase family protein [Bacteroidaceae bacterium]